MMTYAIKHIPTGLYIGCGDEGDHLKPEDAMHFDIRKEAEDTIQYLGNPAEEFEVVPISAPRLELVCQDAAEASTTPEPDYAYVGLNAEGEMRAFFFIQEGSNADAGEYIKEWLDAGRIAKKVSQAEFLNLETARVFSAEGGRGDG